MRLYSKIGAVGLMLCLALGLVPTAEAEECPSVSAASAVLIEAETGRVIFQKDAHTRRPMASTTKIMTALLAAEELGFSQPVTVATSAVGVEGASLGLRKGDTLSAGDLITGMMLSSGNDAAHALALAVDGSLEDFAARMNRRAAALGMTNTTFVTPSGLDEGDHASTAYDMALLARDYLQNERLAAIAALPYATLSVGEPVRQVGVKNHNRLLSLYSACVGIKTGFTKKAGRCLVSAAQKDGCTLVAVTLNAPDDWDDHIRLYEAGFSAVSAVTLPIPGLPAIPVAGGDQATITPVASACPTFFLPQGEETRLTVSVQLPRFLWSGIRRGEMIGQIVYTLHGQELAVVPLTAGKSVNSLPVGGYFTQMGRLFCQLLAGLLTY